jgi:transposase-like protein
MGYLITMSTKELNRIQIIERILSNGLNQSQAARDLGITPRQMRRLIASYKESGAVALTSKIGLSLD